MQTNFSVFRVHQAAFVENGERAAVNESRRGRISTQEGLINGRVWSRLIRQRTGLGGKTNQNKVPTFLLSQDLGCDFYLVIYEAIRDGTNRKVVHRSVLEKQRKREMNNTSLCQQQSKGQACVRKLPELTVITVTGKC